MPAAARKAPIVLYSTNTWIAYTITKVYYSDNHYVWCSPFPGPHSIAQHDVTVPPSSSPIEIYRILHDDVKRGDYHSSKIVQNKLGLARGAESKKADGLIDDATQREIMTIIERAETRDFRPLFYIIPYSLVRRFVSRAPVENRAHPLSDEYIIPSLPRKCFDIIEFPS